MNVRGMKESRENRETQSAERRGDENETRLKEKDGIKGRYGITSF